MGRFSLGALLAGAQNIIARRANEPGIHDLESMVAGFIEWEEYYEKKAAAAHVMAAKLKLIDEDPRRQLNYANSNALTDAIQARYRGE